MTQDHDRQRIVEEAVESIRVMFGALFGVAVRLHPWIEGRAGVLPEDVDSGLAQSLFGGKPEVERLASGLAGREPQLLPELWGQGELSCVVDTNGRGWYSGFFFQKEDDVLLEAKRSKLVSAEFRKAFSEM